MSKAQKDGGLASDKARVGKTPGATASVNLYAILGKTKKSPNSKTSAASIQSGAKPILGFVDLPGFGYAKLSRETKANVELAAERYLAKRRELALGILLVDMRRIPSDDDRAVLAALYDQRIPICVVATKVDKIPNSEVEKRVEDVRKGLGLAEGQPLTISSVTGEGLRDMWRIVMDACEDRIQELKDGDEQDDVEEEGEAWEDGEDLVYDQGYDWVHGSVGSENFDDLFDAGYDDDPEEPEVDDFKNSGKDTKQASDKDTFNMKKLRKQVRDMERRGEI